MRRACIAMGVILMGAALFTASGGAPASAQSRTDLILQRFRDAENWSGHVMVVAHRGGGLQHGKTRFAENSRAAVRDAIRLGADMVEIDVRASRDGVFVVMHDSWLDRTTTCQGEVADFDLAELKRCKLKIEGTGIATGETVPTLAEMLALTRGRILVNIDNKLEAADLPAMVKVARSIGAAREVVIKQNLWNDARVTETRAVLDKIGDEAVFMPIVADDAVRDAATAEALVAGFHPPALELIVWHADGAPMTADGGPLFSDAMREAARRGNWRLWVNTYPIVNRPPGLVSGGRGDDLALRDPEAAWGFWLARGATIIQTDEPDRAIADLEGRGLRLPYEAPDEATVAAGH